MDETRERYINLYTDFGFKRLFGTEMNKDLLISFLNAQELRDYEESIKVYRDLFNVVNTAEKKGEAEGLAEGKAEGILENQKENARKMLSDGMDIGLISKYTGHNMEEILHLEP